MGNLLWVGIGGFIGSVCRYSVNSVIQRLLSQPLFPYGTLAVNLIGCFLIGFLGGMSDIRHYFSPELRLLVFMGALGGFTTFSTFGYESFNMARNGNITATLLNIGIHVVLGLVAVWFGDFLARYQFIQ